MRKAWVIEPRTKEEGRHGGAKRRIAAEKAMRGESNVIKTLQFPWERIL